MTGTLRPRGPNAWELRVSAGRDPLTGKYRQVTRTFHGTKTAAKRSLAELVEEVANGRHTGTDGTLGMLLTRWLDAVETDLSPTTVEGYRSNIATHIRPSALWTTSLRKLEPAMLDEFYAGLRRGGPRPALKASTVRQVHAVIRRACRQGVVWKWLPSNPAALASPGKVETPEHVPPLPPDVHRLIDAAEPELAVLLRLAAATGARRGELCALRWRHIDLDGGVVRIERAIIETGPGKSVWSEKTTKTGNQRKVSLDPETVDILRRHRATWEDRTALVGVPLLPACYVFSRDPDASTPLRPSSVSQAVRRLRDGLGMAGFHLHSLRHAAASQLIGAGVDVVTVANRLGHVDPALTLRVYSHMIPANDRAAGDTMGRLLARPEPEPPNDEGPQPEG